MPIAPPSLRPPLRSPLPISRLGPPPGVHLPPSSVPRVQQPDLGTKAASSSGFHLWGSDGFTFGDILDVINPLQHIPVVATIYRAFTGNAISPASRVLGDTLFGGPIGAATGFANALLEYGSGKDVGEHVLTLLHISSNLQQAQAQNPPRQPVLIAESDATPPAAVSPSPSPASTEPLAAQKSVSLPGASRDQFMAALDAYARNSHMLSASQRQIPQGRLF